MSVPAAGLAALTITPNARGGSARSHATHTTPALLARDLARDLADFPGDPDEIARDETYWARVASAFTIDRSIVNFNNGGGEPVARVCPGGHATAP